MISEYRNNISTTAIPGNTHLNIRIYYNKGGISYYNNEVYKRGFYITVQPVELKEILMTSKLGSGITKLLFEVNRYSEKQLKIAIEQGKKIQDELIELVIEKNKK